MCDMKHNIKFSKLRKYLNFWQYFEGFNLFCFVIFMFSFYFFFIDFFVTADSFVLVCLTETLHWKPKKKIKYNL